MRVIVSPIPGIALLCLVSIHRITNRRFRNNAFQRSQNTSTGCSLPGPGVTTDQRHEGEHLHELTLTLFTNGAFFPVCLRATKADERWREMRVGKLLNATRDKQNPKGCATIDRGNYCLRGRDGV